MLIKGDELNADQKKQVLAAFGYRWTVDNRQRRIMWAGISGAPTTPLVTDEQWLKEHAFHFTKDGARLKVKPRHCVPAYMAE